VRKFIVVDREDGDRKDPIVDSFESLSEAIKFAADWAADYGTCTIENRAGDTVKEIFPKSQAI
jgi:glutamate formiminotransferase